LAEDDELKKKSHGLKIFSEIVNHGLANLTRIFVEPFLFFDAFIAMSPSTLDVNIQCLLAPSSKNKNKRFAATTTTTTNDQQPTTKKTKGLFVWESGFKKALSYSVFWFGSQFRKIASV